MYVTASLQYIIVNENNCGLEDDTSTSSKGNMQTKIKKEINR